MPETFTSWLSEANPIIHKEPIMKISEFRDILYQKDTDTGIVTVTINQPKRKNALSALTFLEFWWAVDYMENDDEAKAMIITGAGNPDDPDPAKEAFSSGGYFSSDVLQGLDKVILNQIDLRDIAQKKLALKMWSFDKPVIAALNGLAIGAGITMPICCADRILASEYAWVQMPFVNLALIPEFGNTYLLPMLIGFQKAREVILTGKRYTAGEAQAMGMIQAVVPHDLLLKTAKQEALKLITPNGAGLAVRLTKRAIQSPHAEKLSEALDLENDGLNRAFSTRDFFEALAAKKEKRAPVFSGR